MDPSQWARRLHQERFQLAAQALDFPATLLAVLLSVPQLTWRETMNPTAVLPGPLIGGWLAGSVPPNGGTAIRQVGDGNIGRIHQQSACVYCAGTSIV